MPRPATPPSLLGRGANGCSTGGSRIFGVLGRFCYRRRWLVVAVWAAAFVVSFVSTFYLSDVLTGGGFADQGSPSERAARLLEERLGTGFTSLQVVLTNDELQVKSQAFQTAAEQALGRLTPGSLPGLTGTLTYGGTGDDRLISPDGHTTVAVLVFSTTQQEVQGQVEAVRKAIVHTRLRTYVTGEPAVNHDISLASERDLRVAEAWALPVALVALVLVFGTVVAAALPVMSGGAAVSVTLGTIYLLARCFDVSVFAMNLASLLGLAVGIDYALFVVARFREELAGGGTVGDAVEATVAHAGRSIYYSGLAVAVGILGLAFFPFPALRSIGLAGAIVVGFSVLAAVTLLPALLGILGHRIHRLRIIRVDAHTSRFWRTWSRAVLKWPLVFLLVALGAVALIVSPITSTKMTMPTATVLPTSAESRQGYDILSRDFDLGALSPISVAVTFPEGQDPLSAENLVRSWGLGRQIAAEKGVADITSVVDLPGVDSPLALVAFWTVAKPALQTGEPVTVAGRTITAEDIAGLQQLVEMTVGDGVAVFRVSPSSSPSSASASDLVRRLRQLTPPDGCSLAVAGESASRTDFFDGLFGRFPWVAGVIVGVTYLILLLLSRSLLVPLKAVVANAFTILMAYGTLVFVFQHGRFESILGYTSSGEIDVIMPVIIFCALFGVTMDYEVFLLARMREAWDRTHSAAAGVEAGLTRSGRVIVSAAALVVVIAGSFSFTSIALTKELGIGIAAAIIFDAVLVRMMLVPAAMCLMGKTAWWSPAWLERRMPCVPID